MVRRWLLCGIAVALGAGVARPTGAQLPSPKNTRPASPNLTRPLRRHPVVALTFDDLPAAGGLRPDETRTSILKRLAEGLKANNVNAFGFVNAVDLENDPDSQQALRAWVGAGMNIGNHTWSHPLLTDTTAEVFEQNIVLNEAALREYAAGRDWHWFRYPNLVEGDTLAKRDHVRAWLREHGYRIAEVTLTFQDDDWSDPYDRCVAKHDDAGIAWLKRSYLDNAAEFIHLGREEEQIAFGHEIPNVLLLHVTAFTSLMLPRLLDLLRREGFRFASLPKVEQDPAYSLDPHAGLPNGGPFPNLFLNSRHLEYPPFIPEPEGKLNNMCR